MKQVLFISGIAGGTRRYRCDHHREQLALEAVRSKLHVHELGDAPDLDLVADLFESDLLILHRTAFDPWLETIIKLARLSGIPVVFETDDLIFDAEIADQIELIQNMPPEEADRFRRSLRGQEEAFRAADAVLTTTAALAAEAESRGKPTYIQRNAANRQMVEASERARAQMRHDANDGPIVLAYLSGSASHNRDFAQIAPILEELLDGDERLLLWIGGPLSLPPSLESHTRVERIPFLAWQELPTLLARVDINLAPLDMTNRFCETKSEIKWMEAALLGVPTIAAATEAFSHAITSGRDGLLAHDRAEWRTHLQRLIGDSSLRREMGEAARRSAYARYLPETAAPALRATLESILERFRDEPAASLTLARETLEACRMAHQSKATKLSQIESEHQDLRAAFSTLLDNRSPRDDALEMAQQKSERLEKTYARRLASILERLERLEAEGALGIDGEPAA